MNRLVTIFVSLCVWLTAQAQTPFKISDSDRLAIQALRGTESGGGGSADRKMFYEPLSEVFKVLSIESEYTYNYDKIKYVDIYNKLRIAKIEGTDEELFDRNGDKVNFLNEPEISKITFSRSYWKSLDLKGQFQFGLHEVLGLMKIKDPLYVISSKLAEIAFLGLEKNKHFAEPIIDFIKEMPDDANPLYILRKANESSEVISAMITYDCKAYKNHRIGPCLVVVIAPNKYTPYPVKQVYLFDRYLTLMPTLR